MQQFIKILLFLIWNFVSSRTSYRKTPTRCNNLSKFYYSLFETSCPQGLLTEKPQQDATIYQNFIIPYLKLCVFKDFLQKNPKKMQQFIKILLFLIWNFVSSRTSYRKTPKRCNNLSKFYYSLFETLCLQGLLTEKPQQDATIYQNFIIPYLKLRVLKDFLQKNPNKMQQFIKILLFLIWNFVSSRTSYRKTPKRCNNLSKFYYSLF